MRICRVAAPQVNRPAVPSAVPARSAGRVGERDFVRSLAKGLAVIAAFGRKRSALTLSEVAEITGQSRAAARRALLTLTALGYAAEDGRRFRLTPKVLDLGFSFLASLDLWEAAYPIMREVSEATGESCSAAVLDGDEIVYVARVPARRIMSVSLGVGARLPAACTSLGRVLLATLPDAALAARLAAADLVARTPHTVTDREALRRIVRAAGAEGHAIVDQELEMGLISLAVPLENRRGETVAALNVSSHAGSTRPDDMRARHLPVLRAAAVRIAKVMGG
jgi:IclR family pca regulon transcriptional regulator